MHLFIHFTFKLIVLPGTCKKWRQLNMNCRWESIVIHKVIGTNSCYSNTHYTMVLRYCSQITSSGKYKLRVRKSTADTQLKVGWCQVLFSQHTHSWGPGTRENSWVHFLCLIFIQRVWLNHSSVSVAYSGAKDMTEQNRQDLTLWILHSSTDKYNIH